MPVKRPFPVDAVLTAVAVGYRNPSVKLIAKRALPPVPVSQEKFKYTVYPLAQNFTIPNTKVGRKGQPNTVEFGGTEETESVEDYGLDDGIPYSDVQAAETARAMGQSVIDPKALAAEGLTSLIELDREVRVAAVVQDANNYSAGRKITLAGQSQLSDFVNSDPYGVIDTGINSTLIYQPNTHVMGKVVWNKIKRHPKLIKAVKGGDTEDGAISRRQYCELFEIDEDNLLIGEGMINTAKKGQAVNLQRVWGNYIALLYLDRSIVSSEDPKITWGFTAELGGRISGSIDDPDVGLQGGERVRVGERVKELVTAPDVGYLISDVIA